MYKILLVDAVKNANTHHTHQGRRGSQPAATAPHHHPAKTGLEKKRPTTGDGDSDIQFLKDSERETPITAAVLGKLFLVQPYRFTHNPAFRVYINRSLGRRRRRVSPCTFREPPILPYLVALLSDYGASPNLSYRDRHPFSSIPALTSTASHSGVVVTIASSNISSLCPDFITTILRRR